MVLKAAPCLPNPHHTHRPPTAAWPRATTPTWWAWEHKDTTHGAGSWPLCSEDKQSSHKELLRGILLGCVCVSLKVRHPLASGERAPSALRLVIHPGQTTGPFHDFPSHPRDQSPAQRLLTGMLRNFFSNKGTHEGHLTSHLTRLTRPSPAPSLQGSQDDGAQLREGPRKFSGFKGSAS